MTWKSILQRVLTTIYEPLEREQIPWTLLGSAASALQGCRVVPRDLDFLAAAPAGVYRFAALMAGYVRPPGASPDPWAGADWWSTAEDPVSAGPDEYGFTWHFGRWLVGGMRVEVAHITAPEGSPGSKDGAGIWEAGPEIWPHLREVSWAGYRVRVVPLEIQVETNLSRGLKGRAREILRIFRQHGYDRALLRQALRHEHGDTFDLLMREEQDPPAWWFWGKLA